MSEVDVGAGLNRSTNESLQKTGTYLSQFITGPASTLSGIVDDYLQHVRLRNLASFETKTREHLALLGYEAPPKPVHPKLAVEPQ